MLCKRYGVDAKEYEISKRDGVFQGQVPREDIPAALTDMPVSYTHLDVYKRQVPDGASLTLWLVQGDVSKSFDVTNLSDPLEYSLSEFENGKIHVRLQINGVEDTISEIYVK